VGIFDIILVGYQKTLFLSLKLQKTPFRARENLRQVSAHKKDFIDIACYRSARIVECF
jgi:hypothetical protein